MTDQDDATEVRRLKAMIEVLDALWQNNEVDPTTMKRMQLEIDAYWARLAQLDVHR